jgi:hypothetical protein
MFGVSGENIKTHAIQVHKVKRMVLISCILVMSGFLVFHKYIFILKYVIICIISKIDKYKYVTKKEKSLVVLSVAIFAVGVFMAAFQFVQQEESFEDRVSLILGGFTEKTFAESLGTGSYGGCFNISFGTTVPGSEGAPGNICDVTTVASESICLMENDSVQVDFSGATDSNDVYTDQLSVNKFFSNYENDFEDGTLGEFTTSGDANWTVISGGSAHNGSFSAQSGAIGDNQESRLRYDFTTDSPVYLEFTFRVSSEDGGDHGRFFLNGVEHITHSGNSGRDDDWRSYSIQIPTPGSYYAEWVYEKDGSWSSGDDVLQLDDVEILEYDPSFHHLLKQMDLPLVQAF